MGCGESKHRRHSQRGAGCECHYPTVESIPAECGCSNGKHVRITDEVLMCEPASDYDYEYDNSEPESSSQRTSSANKQKYNRRSNLKQSCMPQNKCQCCASNVKQKNEVARRNTYGAESQQFSPSNSVSNINIGCAYEKRDAHKRNYYEGNACQCGVKHDKRNSYSEDSRQFNASYSEEDMYRHGASNYKPKRETAKRNSNSYSNRECACPRCEQSQRSAATRAATSNTGKSQGAKNRAPRHNPWDDLDMEGLDGINLAISTKQKNNRSDYAGSYSAGSSITNISDADSSKEQQDGRVRIIVLPGTSLRDISSETVLFGYGTIEPDNASSKPVSTSHRNGNENSRRGSYKRANGSTSHKYRN